MSATSLQLEYKSGQSIDCRIVLTGSKSESNRALILQALSNGRLTIGNLSRAQDTLLLRQALEQAARWPDKESSLPVIDIGAAGTAMRFLTAYLAVKKRIALLTGTQRMKQRPIKMLVEAMQQLGAGIRYAETEGYPPLVFEGTFNQTDSNVHIPGNISSQYITALLLVAAALPMGLRLHIDGELTSKPYVDMTLHMLSQVGIQHSAFDAGIAIGPQDFQPASLAVEPDWSAASYWYSIAALASKARIELPGLKEQSRQGDRAIAHLMEPLGVHTAFSGEGVVLSKKESSSGPLHFDLNACPDLAQTLIVCCAALKREASFSGLETLKIKETDRILALKTELAKVNVAFEEQNGSYYLHPSQLNLQRQLSFATYEDHRMAMSFAPLVIKAGRLSIEEPDVVIKSYPAFWKDMQTAGFNIIN